MSRKKWIIWFEDFGKEALALVGGKGANLGEMIKAGIPVPRGFSISTEAHSRFLEETGDLLNEITPYLAKLSEEPKERYGELSQAIRQIIESKEIPKDIQDTIIEYYETLCQKCGIADLPVAVRSSGVAEDSTAASFAGQFDTYLNVRGKHELLRHVKKCWASLFTTQALSYRMDKGMPAHGGTMSVVVQKMVNVRSAGVCFTINPISGDPSKIVIEGSWGLGESVVGAMVTPDRFIVNKDTLDLDEAIICEKSIFIVPTEHGTKEEEVPLDKRNQPCLQDEEVRRIAELAKTLEQHYGSPQDIEWAVDIDSPFPQNVFLVQARPVTSIPTWKSPTDKVLDTMLSFMRRTA